jgi:signal transduction histidine kinase
LSGIFLLDWAALGISLFNVILLIWLGLIVLLSAEQRTWGVWLAGGGLLMGGLFFISHSAILGQTFNPNANGLNFWWHVGWGPVIASPFAWYLVILWYAGFWEGGQNTLRRRQRIWFYGMLAATLALVALLVFANPLPSFSEIARLELSAAPEIAGVPLLILAYPLYIVACILLALDALRRPGPTARIMGDQARRRARPWLVASSLTLLLVSLLVAWAMLWIVSTARASLTLYDAYRKLTLTLVRFDLAIEALISAAILLVGQAVVAYEVFTSQTLPRQGLRRHWRNAIILAAGVSIVVAWCLTFGLRPIYIVLMAILLTAVFYALFAWRTYVERQAAMRRLRPFVTSQRLYERIVDRPASTPGFDVRQPFYALCRDVLGARTAGLAALGPLAALAGPPLVYPPDIKLDVNLAWIAARCRSPEEMVIALPPESEAGLRWAVPLWSERGLMGVLLLSEKLDGGFFTQEEIEIARASGEHLVDAQASAEMARRLVELQRQRMAEDQVADRRARRALHDDVLPGLHAALLALSSQPPGEASEQAMQQISQAHRRIADLLHEMPAPLSPEVARLGVLAGLRRTVEEEYAGAFDGVEWAIDADADLESKKLSPLAGEVLYYAAREAVRNAARHGRAPGDTKPLRLRVAAQWMDGLALTIEDNGVGIQPGATPGNEGSGHGLALHGTLLAVVGGALAIESLPGSYTRVTLTLPDNS